MTTNPNDSSIKSTVIKEALRVMNQVPGLNASFYDPVVPYTDCVWAEFKLHPQCTDEKFMRDLCELIGGKISRSGKSIELASSGLELGDYGILGVCGELELERCTKSVKDNISEILHLMQVHKIDTTKFEGFSKERD